MPTKHTLVEPISLPRSARPGRLLSACLVAAVVAGCTSAPRSPAPVEDRGSMSRARPAAAANAGTAAGSGAQPVLRPTAQAAPQAGRAGVSAATADESARALPGAENAGKPGYYTVRPGDTVVRIGLDFGQNWRDIVRWNNLSNPNTIEVGQVLRVQPPPTAAGSSDVTLRAVPQSSVTALPAASAPASQAGVAPGVPPASSAQPPVAGEEEIAWVWPAPGNVSVLAGFDEVKNKGLDIAGKAGDPVLAAADGRVVYAGAGLRGYGNLIILKHNNTYYTAYAHNQALLAKEDQTVRKGQKIAEMGSTDADRVKLHFEIRRQGKPVDPARYLVAR